MHGGRIILTGLLHEAKRDHAAPADGFRVERFLRRTGVGWRLGARVSLPGSIPSDDLARSLTVQATDLPSRLEVRVKGDRVRRVGMYAARGDNFLLMSRDAQSRTEIWDAEAAAEIRLQFLCGDVFGEGVVPYRGGPLGDLPWAFRRDGEECPFIGEGSISNRAPEVVVLVPEGCTTERADSLAGIQSSVQTRGRRNASNNEPGGAESIRRPRHPAPKQRSPPDAWPSCARSNDFPPTPAGCGMPLPRCGGESPHHAGACAPVLLDLPNPPDPTSQSAPAI